MDKSNPIDICSLYTLKWAVYPVTSAVYSVEYREELYEEGRGCTVLPLTGVAVKTHSHSGDNVTSIHCTLYIVEYNLQYTVHFTVN